MDDLHSDSRVRYALEELLGFEPGTAGPIRYARPPASVAEKAVYVVPSRFFGDTYGTPASLPRLPLYDVQGVPLLYGTPRIERRGNSLVVHADVVASAYFMLTRYEEWIRRDIRDQHGRFPGKESLPCRAGFLDRPIVDEYAALLRRWAGAVGIDLPPPQREFSVLLTHDVDSLGPRRGWLGIARGAVAGLLRQRSLKASLGRAAVAAGWKQHPADNLDDVIRMDRRLTDQYPPERCRSLFFFLAGGTRPLDDNYRIQGPHARRRVHEASRSGAMLGLHASYDAGIDPGLLPRERKRLQKAAGIEIDRNRHHYLAWREIEHGSAIARAGIRWDATLGYADAAGFRLGVCRPIQLFDPIRREPLGIEEHPLIVMDCTLDRPGYMGLGEEAAFEHVKKLIDAVHRHQGEMVCLWHNTELAETAPGYHRRLYARVLSHLDVRLAERVDIRTLTYPDSYRKAA